MHMQRRGSRDRSHGWLKRILPCSILLSCLGGCTPIGSEGMEAVDAENDVYEPEVIGRISGLQPSTTRYHGFKLPWAKGQTQRVTQYPHLRDLPPMRHAVDFVMGWKSEIRAMRAGVIGILEDSYEDYEPTLYCGSVCTERPGCRCTKTNQLIIHHEDGTQSRYMHLLQGSVSRLGLKPGDRVCQGQHIGNVGHNGVSTAPHLHVEVREGNSQGLDDLIRRMSGQIMFDEAPTGLVWYPEKEKNWHESNNEKGEACAPAPVNTPCSGRTGKYCGADLAGYTGSGSDLVVCHQDAISAVTPCPAGCAEQAPEGQRTCKEGARSPCQGKANGAWCAASLSGYTGAATDLVTCSAEKVASVRSCASGCQVNPPGQEDTCQAPPASPCSGQADGTYCGAALSGYAGSRTDLVSCGGGVLRATQACLSGCEAISSTSARCKPASPCAGKANGKYCGSTLPGYGGNPADLVTCSGDLVASSMSCPNGCKVNPPGTNDVCNPAPSPCAGKANGKYCGSTLPGYGGNPADLVTCSGGLVASSVSCPRGCKVNPPGTNDVCNP